MARILVVDDEPDIRFLVRTILEGAGHKVTLAGSGAEALAVVGDERPELVVLDLMMPEVDGWAVLTELKAHPDETVRTVPVILLTALGGPMDRARGGIEGAVRHLAKPIDIDDLIDSVMAAVDGEPEPVQRRRALQHGLEALARIEDDRPDEGQRDDEIPRLRLTSLERRPSRADSAAPVESPPPPPADLGELTENQRAVLEAVRAAPTVQEAAANLGVSRSNVYASLRRISRKLAVPSVPALLEQVRAGRIIP